jgi:hypothetical protein
MNDVIRNIDDGKVVSSVLLDLSGAFNIVVHKILLQVLHKRFLVDDIPLSWFRSYLTGRTQSISVNGVQSVHSSVACSVPQGSVLGATKFISYTADVVELFQRNSVLHHLFTDDKQIYSTTTIAEIDATRKSLSRCILDVQDWCASSRLQMNANKTELIWFAPPISKVVDK